MSENPPLPRLQPRAVDGHKGDYGHAILIGGSQGMPGSISLAGLACLRGGAGLVTLLVPDCVQPVIASFSPCYMSAGLASLDGLIAEAPEEILALTAKATAVGLGPGLGQSDHLLEVVKTLYEQVTAPLVVDADALNALAKLRGAKLRPAGPRILTPHPGEFARLVGSDRPPARADRETAAQELAKQTGAVVLLKGHQTVITDGQRLARNHTGNAGMATGGCGDVLTGLIVALLGQKLAPFEATQLAAHAHGLAGDLAAADIGEVGLIASDLIDYLPDALR